MDPRIRRIKKEIADIQNDKESGLTIDLVDGEQLLASSLAFVGEEKERERADCLCPGSMTHLIGTFPGPEGSPYEGGHFEVVSRDLRFVGDGSVGGIGQLTTKEARVSHCRTLTSSRATRSSRSKCAS